MNSTNTDSRTRAISQVLLGAANAAGATHVELLSALATLYVATATAHPCCAEAAEYALGLAAARIHVARTANVGNLPALTHSAPSSLQ